MSDNKPVILVVEDEPLLRFHAADVLEDEGFAVAEAADADAALEVLEQRSDVQLLFTDVQMPGRLDGMALVRHVHERWPHILLVITSGRARPGISEIPDAGRFLAKPYRPLELVAQMNELLHRG
jgi:CheY-like chemotaxis protein